MNNQNQTRGKMSIFRWLLFLPLALLIAIVGNLLFGLVLIRVGFQNQTLLNGVSAFLFSFLLVFFAGVFAPSKRAMVAMTLCGIFALLAILSFILAILGVGVFTERVMPDRISIPVLQILGALYAAFLVPALTIRGTTLERLWREIIALGTVVTIFGGVLSIAGLIMGIITRTWTTLAVGTVVLGIGIVTWLFPYIHLFLRVRRIPKE
jgi:hypothetical protein